MLVLASCSGVSIGIPIGGVTVGTTVSTSGEVGVGASGRAGSIGVSGKADQHPGFADVPDDDSAKDHISADEPDSARLAENSDNSSDDGKE
jgi:hypothetical protein